MKFNDLLSAVGIDCNRPKEVLLMRHRPIEPKLRNVFPWLAAERPKLYNAFQQSHHENTEKQLTRAKYLASFIGQEAGKALFVGIYEIRGSRQISYKGFWGIPENKELKKMGMTGLSRKRQHCLWFDLKPTDLFANWKGKLILKWSNERTWCRWTDRNEFPVHAILEESALVKEVPEAEELILTWEQLKVIPKSWGSVLSQWRGVYFIFDASDGKGYVGSAYGVDNIYHRWSNYAAKGHGGNKQLRNRAPQNFQFSILQLVSQQMATDDVIRLEGSWKERLHTREFGLNEN